MIDDGEERDILAVQDEILTMIKRLVDNQEKFEAEVKKRFDHWQHLLVGNGENADAIIPQLREARRMNQDNERRLNKLELRVENEIKEMEDKVDLWRNVVILIGLILAFVELIRVFG